MNLWGKGVSVSLNCFIKYNLQQYKDIWLKFVWIGIFYWSEFNFFLSIFNHYFPFTTLF